MLTWGNMQGVTLVATSVAVLLVLSLSWFVTRHVRTRSVPDDRPRVVGRVLFRRSAWALAGYFVYFFVINMLLGLAGFDYAGSE